MKYNKIKFMRLLDITPSNVNEENKDFYDHMISALKNELNIIGSDGKAVEWHIHRKKKSMIYSQLVKYAGQFATSLYRNERGLTGDVLARGGKEISMAFKDIDIIDFDWNDSASFRLSFAGKQEYFLFENFGSLILISPTNDGINTTLIDLKANPDLTILSHVLG